MSINYRVSAEVIDITHDKPKMQDTFLIDTNVWYWLTYSRASQGERPPQQYQIEQYPNYALAALDADARLFQSGLSLAELAHVIEKNEREIYEKSKKTFIKPKEYRHNCSIERAGVVKEIQAVWQQVVTLSESLDMTVNSLTTDAALNRFQTALLDGYDVFMAEAMQNHGIVQIITDDGDFATVNGIQLFTANRQLIQAARSQGRLKKRG